MNTLRPRNDRASAHLVSLCESAVNHLQKVGINFLALDFDQTIIDIHTGGRFQGSSDELATHVRPIFYHLIDMAHNVGFKIAVVTFSPQTKQILKVLEYHFPEYAHEILIRGRDNSWAYEGNGMKKGKQPYIASAVEEFQTNDRHLDILRKTTLLIDDDIDNIRLALDDGIRGILLNPDDSIRLLDDILSIPITR